MKSGQILIALLLLCASSSTLAAEADDLERATQACSLGAFALQLISQTFAYDINLVDSDQGREAFLAQLESLDKHWHEMPTFKAIWLLSFSDALSDLRHNLDMMDKAANGSGAPKERVARFRAATWEGASNKLANVCMFRGGRLSEEGKL